MRKLYRYSLSLLGTIFVGFAVAFILAIGLGVADLYLAGSLGGTSITIPLVGVSLSLTDVIFLSGTGISALTAGIFIAIQLKRRNSGQAKNPDYS